MEEKSKTMSMKIKTQDPGYGDMTKEELYNQTWPVKHVKPKQFLLGNIVEKIISIITLGQGYRMAKWIAHKLGYPDCGCERRKNWLNDLFSKPKDISLK